MISKHLLVITLLISLAIIIGLSIVNPDPQENLGSIYELKDGDTGLIEDDIIQYLKTKKVPAIGESSHGTKEFYDLKISVIESYLRERIFRLIF